MLHLQLQHTKQGCTLLDHQIVLLLITTSSSGLLKVANVAASSQLHIVLVSA